MAEHVQERDAGERDQQLVADGEVRLGRFARPMVLGEEDVLRRPCLRPPTSDVALQRPKLAGLVFAGMATGEVLEDRLGVEAVGELELHDNRRPVIRERVGPRPPGPLSVYLRG